MSNVEINSQQYIQLDYLRLFRLCKNLNLVNRKRKMPINYALNDISNSRSACKRLLRTLIIYIFPDEYKIKSDYNCYFIEFPYTIRYNLSYINTHYDNLQRSQDPEYIEAINGYTLLCTSIREFIYPRVPYNIKISFSSLDNRNYYPLENRNTTYIYKPDENFYKCAVACLEYKEHCDKYIEFLDRIVNRHKTEKDKPKVKIPKPNIQLNNIITQSSEERSRNTQNAFNNALQRLQERRMSDE